MFFSQQLSKNSLFCYFFARVNYLYIQINSPYSYLKKVKTKQLSAQKIINTLY